MEVGSGWVVVGGCYNLPCRVSMHHHCSSICTLTGQLLAPTRHQLCYVFLYCNYLVGPLGLNSHCFLSPPSAASSSLSSEEGSFGFFLFLMSLWHGWYGSPWEIGFNFVTRRRRTLVVAMTPLLFWCSNVKSPVRVPVLVLVSRCARFNEWRLQALCVGSDSCVMIFKQVIYWLKPVALLRFSWLYLLSSANNSIINASNADRPLYRGTCGYGGLRSTPQLSIDRRWVGQYYYLPDDQGRVLVRISQIIVLIEKLKVLRSHRCTAFSCSPRIPSIKRVTTMTKPDGEIEHISAVTLEHTSQGFQDNRTGQTEIPTGDERRAGVPTYSLKTKGNRQEQAGVEWLGVDSRAEPGPQHPLPVLSRWYTGKISVKFLSFKIRKWKFIHFTDIICVLIWEGNRLPA